MITAATITLARTNYTADDADAGTLAGTLAFTGGQVGDPYTLRVMRRGYESGEFVVHTEDRTFSVSPAPFSWRLATFSDTTGNYSAPCSRIRDDYRVEVLVNGVAVGSRAFTVTPVSVEEMRTRWCRGLPLSGATYETTDDDIIDVSLHAYHQFGYGMSAYPEPIRLVSPLLVEKGLVTAYDRVSDAKPWVPPPSRDMWLALALPPRLLTIHRLEGWMNQEKSVTFQREWYTIDEKSGTVSIVPSNAAILNLSFYGPGFMVLFANRNYVPNFWQFEVTAGAREMRPEHSEYISRAAAIEILTQVGAALAPTTGTGMSISRDGVTESRSFGPRGVYQGIIQNYERANGIAEDGTEKGLKDLRKRFVGLPVVAL